MNEKDFEKLVFGIAHQIRNPCAIILSNANVLLGDPRLKPGARRSLESIVNGVKYIESRLDEFVEFSKPLFPKLREIPVQRILNEVVSIVREKCRLKRIRISFSVDKNLTSLNADHDKLLLALLNVVINSVESINEDGDITMDARKSDHAVVIVVRDTGSGIHPRDLPEVFSPFYSTKQGGTGIGLPVSKGIIEAHKGRIEVQSEQGRGTTITIRLPAE